MTPLRIMWQDRSSLINKQHAKVVMQTIRTWITQRILIMWQDRSSLINKQHAKVVMFTTTACHATCGVWQERSSLINNDGMPPWIITIDADNECKPCKAGKYQDQDSSTSYGTEDTATNLTIANHVAGRSSKMNNQHAKVAMSTIRTRWEHSDP